MADEDQIELELEEDSVEIDVSENAEKDAQHTADADDNFDKAESATQKRIDRLTKKMPSKLCWRLRVMCIPDWMLNPLKRRILNSLSSICVF